ncbi:hypothetical protein BT63DRAFT_56301 [Microthyrium microscopicum]|uniref:Zn(2)-C6 fungal-type domain-containing protein n=1 Tax=Microthyrium microscopicum TaxID=703497 RepID=A0A6A6U215_9PEZI|nr:hypothetical protein BT63DRAFT_56301 [Microthyrium microscopicum]
MENSGRRRESETDYSAQVNKKLKLSNRTGQACDRCKLRKIRCDSTAEGCHPCQAANWACKTTDRITGKATVRGHAEKLEDDVRSLKATLVEYHTRLKALGEHVQPLPPGLSYPEEDSRSYPNGQTLPTESQRNWPARANTMSSSATTPQRTSTAPSISTIIPMLSNPPPPSSNPDLRMLMGTKVSLFGMEIDGTTFDDTFGDTESPRSYQGVLALTAMYNSGQIQIHAPLPSTKNEALHYAGLYFKLVNPYAPVLDKRDMFSRLDKIYDDPTNTTFERFTMPEKIMVHMMFGCIKHQIGVRRSSSPLVNEGIEHFKYCMVHFREVLQGRELGYVQAVSCLALFSRNYQKPEAAWFIMHAGLWIAIEIGLNRSASTLSEAERSALTPHSVELRKRCFWTIYGLSVIVSGRLGRPMPIRLQDIDIEFPDPVHDYLPNEIGVPEFDKCSFRVFICGCRLLVLLSQLYSTMYCVRRNIATFDVDMARLEEEFHIWKNTIPPELVDPDTAVEQAKPWGYYLQVWQYEFMFLLHHPVLRQTESNNYDGSNLLSCLKTCDDILDVTKRLCKILSVDSQWLTVAFLLAVVFTTLFIHESRKDCLTEKELSKLKADMNDWHEIFGLLGRMLGGGSKLQVATRRIVTQAIDKHDLRFAAKRTAAVAAANITQPLPSSTPQQSLGSHPNGGVYGTSNTSTPDLILRTNIASKSPQPYLPKNSTVTMDQPPSQYVAHGPQPYPYSEATTPQVGYQASTFSDSYQAAPSPSNASTQAYTPQPQEQFYSMQQEMGQQTPLMNQWTRWTQGITSYYPSPVNNQNMASQMGQDYINSANSLVALSEGNRIPMESHSVTQASNDARNMWPMGFLDSAHGANGQPG